MTTPLFISSPVSVLTGDAARVALETTNDSAYYIEGKGVLSVPLERWQYAQAYERYTWLTQGLSLTEDRNTEHAAGFDGYKSLPQNVGHIIEVGCGPFTNMIHIIPDRETNSISLLDPLASSYLRHPHCTYRDGTLLKRSVELIPFAIEMYHHHSYGGQFNTPYKQQYDTVVMVNVLSHCLDAATVFTWVNAHLMWGGSLVFHEPARDIDVRSVWDVGHPLSYTQDVIDEFLSGYIPTYKNGDYFIGVKK